MIEINKVHLVILFFLSNILLFVFSIYQPLPYVDEIFHVPQTYKYCELKFNEWDNKITTLPGLYILGFIYSKIISLGITKTEYACSIVVLRSLNSTLLAVSYYVIFKIFNQLKQREYKEKGGKGTINTEFQSTKSLVLVTFPLYFFFHFLYYTDVPSTLSVLLVYYFSLKKSYILSPLIGLFSVILRQTNIIWVFFIAIDSLLRLIEFRKEKKNDDEINSSNVNSEKSLVIELIEFIRFIFNNLIFILKVLGGYVVVGILFLIFLKVNGGIVVGDKSNHESSFHGPQFFYFTAFTILFSLPIHLLSPLANPFEFIKVQYKSLIQSPLIYITKSIGILSIFYYIISKYTIIHIFILSDNRHYTFYLFNRFFIKYNLFKYSLIPLYIYSLWAMIKSFKSSKQSNLWIVFYFLCTLSVLLPSPLVEPRYYIVPFLIYQLTILNSPISKTSSISLTLLYNIIVNILTIYIFLKYPFSYPDGSIGRFFW